MRIHKKLKGSERKLRRASKEGDRSRTLTIFYGMKKPYSFLFPVSKSNLKQSIIYIEIIYLSKLFWLSVFGAA